jgi:hypothetical protein
MDINEAKGKVLEYFKKVESGQAKTIACVKKVSSSGMSRVVSFMGVEIENDKISTFNLTWYINKILGYSIDKNIYGIRVSGAGMDMVFHVLYNLLQASAIAYVENYSRYLKYETL